MEYLSPFKFSLPSILAPFNFRPFNFRPLLYTSSLPLIFAPKFQSFDLISFQAMNVHAAWNYTRASEKSFFAWKLFAEKSLLPRDNKYRRSPIPKGGLEIPIVLIVYTPSSVFDRMKEYLQDYYQRRWYLLT